MEALTIPQDLIAEVVNGKPYYYKGYREVLDGQKRTEDLMGSSYVQAWIIESVLHFLFLNVDRKTWRVLSNEVGLHMGLNHNRSCDIALFEKAQLAAIYDTEAYIALPPKVVIEVDIRLEAEERQADTDYLMEKTQDLLDFGVERVIWILTRSQKIYVAEPNKPWLVVDWHSPISLLPEVDFILSELLKD